MVKLVFPWKDNGSWTYGVIDVIDNMSSRGVNIQSNALKRVH
jgi:hypothetical protein